MEMERKKRDELAVVKAAAWAWYQHGSGSDGKPMPEFDITRRSGPASARPSRYKVEAMRNSNNTSGKSPTTSPINTHDHEYDSLLLDSYEIERISKRLNHLIEFSGIKVYNELLGIMQDTGDDDNYHKNYCLSSDIGDSSSGGGRRRSSSRKNKISNSHFLKRFLQRHAVICGRSQDVDDSSAIFRHRRRPEN